MWFYETLYPDLKLGINGNRIFRKKTKYQDIKIYDTPRFGKLLQLDGVIQTTEFDEFIYHEMLTHPLLLSHPDPKKVLIIGAGDGGVLREVLKHKRIKEIYMVEIDGDVIELSKKELPSLSEGAFDNKRANIIIGNGAEFVAGTDIKFDIAMIDSSDPIGPAKALFSKKFYENIYSVLSKNGMMIRQCGSTMFQPEEMGDNYKLLKKIFPFVNVQLAAIPTYIGGFFSFIIASKMDIKKVSQQAVNNRFNILRLNTKYYNPDIHFASRVLPNYVRRAIR